MSYYHEHPHTHIFTLQRRGYADGLTIGSMGECGLPVSSAPDIAHPGWEARDSYYSSSLPCRSDHCTAHTHTDIADAGKNVRRPFFTLPSRHVGANRRGKICGSERCKYCWSWTIRAMPKWCGKCSNKVITASRPLMSGASPMRCIVWRARNMTCCWWT